MAGPARGSAMAGATSTNAAQLIGGAKRITVKVGSSLLVDGEGLRGGWISSLAKDLAALIGKGREVIVVSSGAVALGRGRLGQKPSSRLDAKQAAAALGQP